MVKLERISLPSLDYDYDALEPAISQEIMELHHKKHHKAYVDGANAALDKIEKFRNGEMETINMREVLRDLSFHMNGHVLHSIFWKNMKPYEEGNRPHGEIGDAIEEQFGSFETFKKEFFLSAKNVEGVGWAVLVKDDNSNLYVLNIEKHNLMHIAGFKVVLALDVWEHAYYLQYKNDRASYINEWFNVVNWDDVEIRFKE